MYKFICLLSILFLVACSQPSSNVENPAAKKSTCTHCDSCEDDTHVGEGSAKKAPESEEVSTPEAAKEAVETETK